MSREEQPVRQRIVRAALILVLLPVLLPLVAFALTLFLLHRAVLYLLIWLTWLPAGKDVLLVYSDSPIWHDYMTGEVLPLVQERAVVLNWSERRKWPMWSLAVQAARSFGGQRDFNPMVALFRPFRRARLFRFWPAFKDWKRGNTEPVSKLRDDLLRSL